MPVRRRRSSGTKPLGIESRPRAKFTLATKSLGRLRGRGVVDGISRLQIAADAKTLQQRDQLIDRLMAQLPDPPAAAGTIAIRQFREFEVRFLQQERRARCRAASPDDRGFQNRRGDARGRKGVRDQGAGHSATHDSDSRVVLTRQRRISLLASCGVRKPQRSSDAQPSLRRAQRRRSRRDRRPCARLRAHSASDSGASAGPEITSPVGLKRDP